jgi:hypothetical protein
MATTAPATALTTAQVLALADGAGFSKGAHSFTPVDLVALGLTPGEIAKFKTNTFEGHTVRDDTFMVQLAYEESGFNPNAHGVGPVDDSYGLWQINMLGGNGPANRAKFNLAKNEDLYDPATNARVAHAFVAQLMGPNNTAHSPLIDFAPWKGSLGKAVRAIANGSSAVDQTPPLTGGGGILPSNPLDGITNLYDAIKASLGVIASLFSKLLDPKFWRRIGIAVLGFLIIVGALIVWNKDAIMDTGKKAAEVGAVAA